ncbi:MAG: hypothetical protein EI684_02655 [Candidatus Viridilinea halotolerans]|uniref:Baseplate protein J-like domain-containing protein n=1 Tax=Candidatus Viridilinea halotolerans TaxID=2491704 RepID=A0A426U8L8_9CHLR|nr:MAG: hypothetical protein EI684_02655 [Candidatus Viridilinea halotolerans]
MTSLDDLDLTGHTTPEADLAAADAGLAAALRPSSPPVRPTLSDEDLLAASLRDEPVLTPAHEPRRAADRRSPAPTAHPGREDAFEGQTRAPAPRRTGTSIWLTLGLSVALVGILALIATVLLMGSRVTIAVTPPARPETIDLITDLPLPLVAPETSGSSAVAAAPLRDEVIFSMEGEVTEGTMTPAGSASGVVVILNSSQQAIFLPAGSEFVALRSDGREVPFVSVADVQVPPSTTSDMGAEVITRRGQASVTVQARSPGSGSNVEGNSVRRVTPLGSASFSVGAGGLLVEHGPLVGGSEEEVRIVKDRDVEALLAPALEGMDSLARERLATLAQAQQLALDPSTIAPRRSELEQLRGFDYNVQPALGESLDPTAPRFTLILSAEYSALATQATRPLEQQLGMALTEQLRQAGRIAPGDCRAPSVNAWRWDGESLLVNGQIAPDNVSPGCRGGLDAEAAARVLTAVRGQSRAAAQANLDALVDAGLIGGYTLPPVDRMPSWDWQIEVQW